MAKLTKIDTELFLDRKYRGLRRGKFGNMNDYFIKKSDILKMARNLDKNIEECLPEYYSVYMRKTGTSSYDRPYCKTSDSIQIGCRQYSKAKFKDIIEKVKSIK